ncbi:MAG: hypothetical protein ACLQBK_22110 [Candidatus Sulfotelmatobacter sp.]
MAKKIKATQNEAVETTAEPSKTDGSITNEELARKVIDGVRLAKLTAEDLLELRQRFAKLKKNGDILGYHRNEWEKFCDEKLGMTPSKARRWIRDTCNAIGMPTPGSKHDGSKHRQYSPAPWHHTPCGEKVDVARSAAQKAVRDGDENTGGYWIRQLYFAGYDVWKALGNFASEDVGIADLSVKTHVLELKQLADMCKSKDHRPTLQCVDDKCKNHSDLLCVLEAMQICCRAQKCRAADEAELFYRENPTYKPPTPEETAALDRDDVPKPAIDDKVFDKHTAKGSKMGRGIDHFKTESSQLKNKSNVIPFTPPTTACPHCGGTGRVAA